MHSCPKCQGNMTPGHAYAEYCGWRAPVSWATGRAEKSIWTGLSMWGKDKLQLAQFACDQCGFVEHYLDRGFQPNTGPNAGTAIPPSDARQLEGVVEKLLDRIAVLERIATDPADRISREIEELKALPPKGDGEG